MESGFPLASRIERRVIGKSSIGLAEWGKRPFCIKWIPLGTFGNAS